VKRSLRDAKTGSLVSPITPTGFSYHCSVAGTSGASEPTWNAVLGQTTTDGTVTWVTVRLLTVTGTVTTATTKRIFRDSSRTEADHFFRGGLLTWTSGLNSGLKMEVKVYTSAVDEFELSLPMPYAIMVGDAYSVQAGCSKRLGGDHGCMTKFDNVKNYRGEPHVPQKAELAVAGYL
jgi:uncharacterized phage protein (TIGR02218 family)